MLTNIATAVLPSPDNADNKLFCHFFNLKYNLGGKSVGDHAPYNPKRNLWTSCLWLK